MEQEENQKSQDEHTVAQQDPHTLYNHVNDRQDADKDALVKQKKLDAQISKERLKEKVLKEIKIKKQKNVVNKEMKEFRKNLHYQAEELRKATQ